MKAKLLYIAFTLLFPVLLPSQSAPQPAFKVTADTLQIRIGEPLTLTLEARKGSRVRFPIAQDSIGKVQLLDTTEIDTLKTVYRQRWTVTAYDSGQYKIDSLPFTINGDTAYAKPISFQVYAVKLDTTHQKMYDIKPIYKAPYTFAELLPWLVVGILFVVLLTGLVLFILNRRRRKKPVKRIVLPPHLEALERLEALDKKSYLKEGAYKAYYSELTDILRYYFERRYAFQAMELTSGQILAHLKHYTDLPKELYAGLKQFLKTADLVKFAKMTPHPSDATRYRDQVEQIVHATTPQPEEAPQKDKTAL